MSYAVARDYAQLGLEPAEVYNWGSIDVSVTGGGEYVSGLVGNPNYGDAEYIASAANPLMDVNYLPKAAGGRGVYIPGANGGLELPSANHNIADGAFTLIKWFARPNDASFGASSWNEGLIGAFIDANNYISVQWDPFWLRFFVDFKNGGTGPSLIIADEVFPPEFMSDTESNLQMFAVSRDGDTDELSYYYNGYDIGSLEAFNLDLSTATLNLGKDDPGVIHIETVIFEEKLIPATLSNIWNSGAGTFGGL